MEIPFYIWLDIIRNQDFVRFLLKVSTAEFWLRGGGVWFVGAIIPLYLIVPWWHLLMKGMKYSWIPTLIVFLALICLGQWRQHLCGMSFFFLGCWLGKPVSEGKRISLIIWGFVPILLYVVCKVTPALDLVPRSLLLVAPLVIFSALIFEKAGKIVKPLSNSWERFRWNHIWLM